MHRRQLRDEDAARDGDGGRGERETSFGATASSVLDLTLNCATRLNLHYPIVGTAPPVLGLVPSPFSPVPLVRRIDARD